MTTYIILRRSARAVVGTVLYELVGTWDATGPEVAIRRIADGVEGEYIAVPKRNWTRVVGENEEVKPRFTFNELSAIPDDEGINLTMGGEMESDDEGALPDPQPAPLDPDPEPVPA